MADDSDDRHKLAELGKLAAGIAHEINSPLQYIAASIDVIAQTVADLQAMLAQPEPDLQAARELCAEIPTALDDAETGIQRVMSIARSVREFAHTRRSAAAEVVDINAQIELVAELVYTQYKHELDLVLDLAISAFVIGDADRLSRALLNIVINAAQAIQATRQGDGRGLIVIRSRTSGDRVFVDIEDTGKGIPCEHWDHVFEPFFTTKPRGQGTGQGLPMARAAIVDGHRGTLTFESKPGIGTTFRIALPGRARSTSVPPPSVGSAA